MRRRPRLLSGALLAPLALLAACATGGGRPTPEAGPATPAAGAAPAAQPQLWPVKAREHLDLWLHGFAMLEEDTARVPYFRRGYHDELTVERNRRNVTTLLDENRERLRARLTANRRLADAQFIPLYLGTWEEIRGYTRSFVQAEGDPRRAGDRQTQTVFGLLAQTFPTQADRDWLDLFVRSLDDERSRFYHAYWVEQQNARRPALAAADSLWQQVYRPRLQRFLGNTQLEAGDLYLSLPLGGEGRSVFLEKRRNGIAVAFPQRAGDAPEAIYTLVHEAVGGVTSTAVDDNTTPNDRRRGVVAAYLAAALVRGGAILLERTAPELVDGYARFYLRQASVPLAGRTPAEALAAAFPLPDVIRDAIARQFDVVLGGI